MPASIAVIGITDAGPESLPPHIIARIKRAEILCGGARHLAFFPELNVERWVITNDLEALVRRLRAAGDQNRIVILASGDPNFYGIGSYLSKHIPKDRLEVIPNVTAVQLAFARLREPWHDAVVVSAHGRSIEPVIEAVRDHPKVAVLTDPENTPAAIAQRLLSDGLANRRVFICEHLDGAKERITETTLAKVRNEKFDSLCLMVLLNHRSAAQTLNGVPAGLDPASVPRVGIPDHAFERKGGLITRQEVRVISLSKMCLREADIVWDIGAGSGSVSVEAARLARRGTIYAIEKEEEAIRVIEKNIEKFDLKNVRVIHETAPTGLDQLPDPNAVFIGGSGGHMREILSLATRRLKEDGHIVANMITLDSLNEALTVLKESVLRVSVTLVNIARSKELMGKLSFEAINPVYIVSAERNK